jgi:hypothetical protein
MARWVVFPEVADEVDGTPVLDVLGDDITTDAIRYAHERTGELKASIHKTDLSPDSVSVIADPHHPDEPGDEGLYGYWAEVGTSDTPAERFLERALYQRRNP